MSKDCRLVNGGGGGGGYVNHCEQALGDKNEMVVAVSKIAVGGDHHQHQRHNHNNHHNHQTTAVANRVYSVASSEIDMLKEFTLSNFDLIKELKVCLVKKDEKIEQLSKEVNLVSDVNGVRRISQHILT